MTSKEDNTELSHQSATVYIVDDNQELNNALELNLRSEGYKVKTFTNAEDFLKRYSTNDLSCLLLDVRMPGMSGDALQKELLERDIKVPIIFMSGYSDVSVAVDTLKLGAIDFLTKPIADTVLLSTINKALHADVQRRQKEQQSAPIMKRYEGLTKREREVMNLVVQGRLNKLIADELDISINTVENHRSAVMHKMQAKTIAELVCICLLNGLVEVEER